MLQPNEAVNELITRLSQRDLDGAMELVAEDAVFDNVGAGVHEGRAAVREAFAVLVDGSLDIREVDWRIGTQLSDGETVMHERTDRFLIGEHWVTVRIAAVFEVKDGLIRHWRDYLDHGSANSSLEQNGIDA